jgi:zinc transport system ATP-binding protein
LRIDGLVAGYGRPVVGPLSMMVGRGEIVGLSGANGCGKSTILNAIAGRAEIFAGQITQADGVDLAYQTQEPVRLPCMPLTGHELLRYAQAAPSGMPRALESVLHKRIDRLSGGQFQLMCIWAAVSSAATLVMLDEPTNNLDPDHIALVAGILAGIQGRATPTTRAVLVVSHERRFLRDVCSRVIEIE